MSYKGIYRIHYYSKPGIISVEKLPEDAKEGAALRRFDALMDEVRPLIGELIYDWKGPDAKLVKVYCENL